MYIFLFTLILFVNSSSLSIILLSSPKKRPELSKTALDLENALKANKGNNIIVTKILFVKGCLNGCDFKEFDEVIEHFKIELKEIDIDIPQFYPTEQDGLFLQEWFKDSLAGTWIYIKHLTINFYFIQSLKKIYINSDDDFVLMSEDDQTYEEQTFKAIRSLIDIRNEKRLYSKISWCHHSWCKKVNTKKFTIECKKDSAFGAFGTLRNRKELGIFLRYLKFSRFVESEDTLAEYLCRSLDMQVVVYNVSKHFGRDKMIPS